MIKFIDIFICSLWCILIGIRMFYPKSYPPLDMPCLGIGILFAIVDLKFKPNEIYRANKEWKILILRNILIALPLIVGIYLHLYLGL